MLDVKVTAELLAQASRSAQWNFADKQGRVHGQAIADCLRLRNEWPEAHPFRAHYMREIRRHTLWCKRWFGLAQMILEIDRAKSGA